MEKRLVWFIDEDEAQRRTFKRVLQKLMPDSVEVRSLEPFPAQEDYTDILQNEHTVCLVIDEKLKTTGVASYFGIELAQYLRGIDQKLPIYILTNFPEDVASTGLWSVEDIIAKKNLDDDEESEIVKARMIRRINVYEDVLRERQERFRELLRKALSDELEADELEELEELQTARSAPIVAEELRQLGELERLVEEHKRILGRLKGEEEENAL